MVTEFQNVRLAALIIVDDALTTPLVLGRSLTELQIARVVSLGARHVVCLVRQVSPQLLGVADHLRANGLTIDIVRSVADAADAIHPDETVFLVASQVLISTRTLGMLLDSGVSSLLCVANSPASPQFEIIDAAMRWAGYALLDGATLRRVAGMVGDWDAASTLLRHLVQEGAHRVLLDGDQLASAMLVIRSDAEALSAGRKLLNDNIEGGQGLGSYWIGKPISGFLARLAGELGLKSKVIEYAAVGAALVAALVGLAGWLGFGLFILLLAFFARAAATRLASAVGELNPSDRLFRTILRGTAIMIVGACAVTLASRTGQWGCLLLGALLIGSHALIIQRRMLKSGTSRPNRWMSDMLSTVVILLLGIASTLPVTGLFIASVHAVGSYLWMQRPVSGDFDTA
ncbi:MAG: hypothetical protein JWL66_1218 [Sphingomonadales bacterium]|nr:hypothetical protein [Sphingomonadales bacterium]